MQLHQEPTDLGDGSMGEILAQMEEHDRSNEIQPQHDPIDISDEPMSKVLVQDKRSNEIQPQQEPTNLGDGPMGEILARVPYKSLCRFNCVSKPWNKLCSDPRTRMRSPKTLTGFFYCSRTRQGECPSYVRHFMNLSGRSRPMVDPSLPFLSTSHDIEFVDSCNGFLLLKCRKTSLENTSNYIVCNPMTQKWTFLPSLEATSEIEEESYALYLGFDPAVSSHFTVFAIIEDLEDILDDDVITRVGFYSSKTGSWTCKKAEWDKNDICLYRPESAFFNGTLHLLTLQYSVLTVDTEGNTWRRIPTPRYFTYIGLSQGHLYGMSTLFRRDYQLGVWVLEDYNRGEWVMKYDISVGQLLGTHVNEYERKYWIIAIHPDSSLIFLHGGRQINLLSYDMESKKSHDICTLGADSQLPYLPYIPCFSDW